MIYGNYLRDKYNNTAIKLADAEGVPCVMEYSKGKNLRNYEIYGNSMQNSTPSPDNPVEIQSVGDLTKNLFDVNAITSTNGGYIENGVIYVTNYPYATDITPEKFLEMTGLQEGDTFTTTCEYTQLGATTGLWGDVTFLSKTSGYSNIDLLVYSNSKTSTIPEGFNSTNYNKMYIYSGRAPEEGDIYGIFRNFAVYKGSYTANTMPEYDPYHKYDIPITVTGKNLLPNSNWMSGAHQNGFTEQVKNEYITEYTQNSVSFNLSAWTGVSSPRFQKDSVKRIVFKINQNQINSDDGYINFYVVIQGYDNDNNKIGNRNIYDNAVANTEYVFDFSRISSHSFYANSTQFSFCILARKNALSNFMVYDIAYYAETDTAVYEPYVGETKHIYLNEPLRKVGDYADYIDFKNQKVVRNVGETTFNGSETWVITGDVLDGVYKGFAVSNSVYNIPKGTKLICLSDKFPYASGKEANIVTIGNSSAYGLRIIIGAEYVPDLDVTTFKTWLSANNVKIIYPIATPTEEPISLQTLKTVKGTSIMSVDTSIQPSNIKGKYIRT